MKQIDFLSRIMQLVVSSGVCPKTDSKDWAKTILFAHTHGYLYASPNLDTVACAYRVKEGQDVDVMPEKEEGDYLYVAFAASKSPDKTSLLKLLKQRLKENDIKKVIYYKRNSDSDFKSLKVKECVNG